MEGLPAAVFKLYFRSLGEIELPPYKGSTFRGGFGRVFKRIVCINSDRDCNECLLKYNCVYSYVFETPVNERKGFNTTHLPHPYVLEPPLENKTHYLAGDTFSANLILFGKAIDFLPYFIFVFENLGRNGLGKGRGQFLLQRVENLSHPLDHNGKIIFDTSSKRLSGEIIISTISDFGGAIEKDNLQSLTLNFLSPTRITFENKLVAPSEFNFLILIKNLLRRIHLLMDHCDSELRIDYKDLLIKAENIETAKNGLHWYDWERYSARQDDRMKLGGFKGKITFAGSISPFMPIIKFGEYIHIGKDTSFGLGKYAILKSE